MFKEGLIVKATGGLYYVQSGAGLYECRARGIFRRKGISPLVGDRVKISLNADAGVVEEILPRKNALVRPPLANLDRLVIVASAVEPRPDLFIIDELAAIAEHNRIEPVIVLTKHDLRDMSALAQLYRKAGFETAAVSNLTGEGVGIVAGIIRREGVSAFAGNSGVGKSSLLNRIMPSLGLKVGEVSKKLGRGRHTTRTAELFRVPGGEGECYAADTPGFSALDFTRAHVIRKEELQYAFRDFAPYLGRCRFADCSHVREEGCAVLEAVRRGAVAPSRHASYCAMYEQAQKVPDWEHKKER